MAMRGTTPTQTFTVPFEKALIKEVEIVYVQNEVIILTKTEKDCTIVDNSISVDLSQEDTFKFDSNERLYIQIRILTTGGKVWGCKPKKLAVGKCFSDEVLV